MVLCKNFITLAHIILVRSNLKGHHAVFYTVFKLISQFFITVLVVVVQEMMYIWNGYTVIGKHKDLTEGMLKTLNEEQQKLELHPSKAQLCDCPISCAS